MTNEELRELKRREEEALAKTKSIVILAYRLGQTSLCQDLNDKLGGRQ